MTDRTRGDAKRPEGFLFYDRLPIAERPMTLLERQERLLAVMPLLMDWYEQEKRSLPWRQEITPYRVWISEIMLQQTRVEAVKPYYQSFMERLPRISSLAEVPEDELMKLWQGLGYYSRARNLKKAASLCMENYAGELPDSREELLKLPGIGSYTAGAIASIAYGENCPAVDGNVLRVVHRILADRSDIAKQQVKQGIERELGQVMRQFFGEERKQKSQQTPGMLNQAWMELGACICIPNGAPHCSSCPIQSSCLAGTYALTEEIPYKAPKKARRIEKKTICIVEDDERLLLHRREESGLLAGLYELPSFPEVPSAEALAKCWGELLGEEAELLPLADGRHIFSHVEWHMKAWRVRTKKRLEAYRTQLEEAGYLLPTKAEIREGFSIPSAFDSWKDFWEET